MLFVIVVVFGFFFFFKQKTAYEMRISDWSSDVCSSDLSLTPFYDVLSAQPSLDAGQVERKQMKLAMSVGDNNHYRIDQIHARHFIQTAERAGLPKAIVREAIEEVRAQAENAITQMEAALPTGFPHYIHESVSAGVRTRLPSLALPDRKSTRLNSSH